MNITNFHSAPNGEESDASECRKTEHMKNHQLISMIAHEIKTPLTSIRGSLGLLSVGTFHDMPERARALLAIAHSNCERLACMINDILDIDRIESGDLLLDMARQRMLPLVDRAIDAMQAYAAQHQTTFRFVSNTVDGYVNADAERITQVIANLLSNAIKFSSAGSIVEVQLARKNGWMRLSVTNSGEGIPAEFRKRIFQKFSLADSSDTRKNGGAGLSLSISKSIIEKHDGIINFVSEGANTEFYFEIPLASPPRILHIDGDSAMALVVTALLEPEFHVVQATTLAEARSRLAQESFSMIILDLQLPDGDGATLLASLPVRNAMVPVVVLSGRGLEPGASDNVKAVLIKSRISNEKLFEILRDVGSKAVRRE